MKLQFFLVTIFSFLLIGCTDDSKIAIVSGTITVDGKPAASGSIAFFSVDGLSPTTGAEIVDGRYRCEVPFAETKVQIRVPKMVGKRKLYDTPDSPEQAIMEEILPPQFNEKTTLRFTAEQARQEKNWDLLTK